MMCAPGSSKSYRKRFLAIFGVLLVVVAVLSLVVPLPPYGRFRMKNIGNVGDAYYEIANGKVTSVMTDGYGPEATLHPFMVGSYRKVNGKWLLKSAGGEVARLQATLWRITIVETNGVPPVTFRRMFSFP